MVAAALMLPIELLGSWLTVRSLTGFACCTGVTTHLAATRRTSSWGRALITTQTWLRRGGRRAEIGVIHERTHDEILWRTL